MQTAAGCERKAASSSSGGGCENWTKPRSRENTERSSQRKFSCVPARSWGLPLCAAHQLSISRRACLEGRRDYKVINARTARYTHISSHVLRHELHYYYFSSFSLSNYGTSKTLVHKEQLQLSHGNHPLRQPLESTQN